MLSEAKGALEAWMRQAARADAVSLAEARPLSGGAIQENWLLEVDVQGGPFAGRQDLVLRTDAPSGVAVSHGRAEEFALLRAAIAAGVTVPEPLWLCEDPDILGKTFQVMRKVEGVALGTKVVKDPRLGGDRAGLAERLGRELARIHSVLPPHPGLEFLGAAPADPALADVAQLRAYVDALGEPRPVLEWGLRWAELHPPPPPEKLTLVHGDFRTGNYMVDETGLTAILDWEFAAWGDPARDLGWFCAACWRFGRNDLEAGGIAPRAAFYRGYEAESGRRIEAERVAYWEVMAHIRWDVIALQQGQRHLSGAERSLDLALTGRRAAELDLAILRLTPPEVWRSAG
ncbi:phosphotransferase family protein [Algihabitans albus]|uniref:phosphotransferase family protein n=1 Tax=Algihabitans albus TaxID=2164067 RepID=UPI001F34AB66|nr:phosphotransferase family protein [Algihabitans albus]